MSHAYTWNPETKELSIYNRQLTLTQAQEYKLDRHEVVDQHYDRDSEKYGRFVQGKDGWALAWESLDWNQLSPEFRTNLLLLGVT